MHNKSLQLSPCRQSGSVHAVPCSMQRGADAAAQLNSMLERPENHEGWLWSLSVADGRLQERK